MIGHLKAGILFAALAQLAPTQGTHVQGTVQLHQRGDVVHVVARLTGLTPGLHAFHLHAHGDCTDAAATGTHHAPDGSARDEHHGGEFGALVADENGQATLNMLLAGISLAPGGGSQSVLGRSIVVHAAPDALIGWPAPILACGVIRSVP